MSAAAPSSAGPPTGGLIRARRSRPELADDHGDDHQRLARGRRDRVESTKPSTRSSPTHDPKQQDRIEFRGHQYDAGLAWVHFPEGFGGLGVRPELQRLVEQRLRVAGAPPLDAASFFLALAGPTIVTHGTDEQRRRFLRPMFTGEERWCQLFSEPGAGSDFAGLATKAVRDGDEWIVNGQKVWNTIAHLADWGMLVTRSNPDAPKHKGMTYFAVDMHSPGVEVRPLRQITGEAEFNEVYLTDARIPDANRIGAEGEGWRVSLTTLMNERATIGGGAGGGAPKRGSGGIAAARRRSGSRCPTIASRGAEGSADADVGAGGVPAAHQHPRRRATARPATPDRKGPSPSWRWPSSTSRCSSCASTCSAPTG